MRQPVCCAATLQVPGAGSIRFGDIDVLKDRARLRATLGYLPQDFGVYPRVSRASSRPHACATPSSPRACAVGAR